MTSLHAVDPSGRYDGLTLRDALPLVVREIVDAFDPIEVIVFGSVARGEEGPDSDIDLMVVFDCVEQDARRLLMRHIRGAIRTFVPVDIVVADLADIANGRDAVGSSVYWPLREGASVYHRPVEHAD